MNRYPMHPMRLGIYAFLITFFLGLIIYFLNFPQVTIAQQTIKKELDRPLSPVNPAIDMLRSQGQSS